MKTKLRRALSLSITDDESTLLDNLNAKGISNVAVFRKGLYAYTEEFVTELAQNNVA